MVTEVVANELPQRLFHFRVSFGSPGLYILTTAANRYHDLNLFQNFLQGNVLRQTLEELKHGPLVGHAG